MLKTLNHLGSILKLLITIFVLGSVMQISIGTKCRGNAHIGSPANYVESHLKDLIDFAKHTVKQSDAIITAVVERLPDTEDYSDYRQQLEAFSTKLDLYKMHSGICAKKSLDVMTAFVTLTDSYKRKNATAEAQDIISIMNSFGLSEFEREMENVMAIFEEERFQVEYEELIFSGEITKVSAIYMEIC